MNRDIYILEKACDELENWADGSNYADYSLDQALTKERLERVIFYLQTGAYDLAKDYLGFLKEWKEDLGNRQELLEAVENIIVWLEESTGE